MVEHKYLDWAKISYSSFSLSLWSHSILLILNLFFSSTITTKTINMDEIVNFDAYQILRNKNSPVRNRQGLIEPSKRITVVEI